jgi:hypothetical protein
LAREVAARANSDEKCGAQGLKPYRFEGLFGTASQLGEKLLVPAAIFPSLGF